MRIHAFSALRAPANRASEVGCPPYDVVDFPAALAICAKKANSFMRVVRAEVDFPPGTDPHDQAVYQRARENLAQLQERRMLVRDVIPQMYVYRQAKGGRRQCGLVCCVDVAEYRSGAIRKHEVTRPDKEEDRTQHMLGVGAHCEAVLLTVTGQEEFVRQLSRDMNDRPLLHYCARDGVTHTLWSAHSAEPYQRIFAAVPQVYIADGHHRSAAADRAARLLEATGDEESQRFPAVIYPSEELRILPYHRLVRLGPGQTLLQFESRLRESGELSRLASEADPEPRARGEVGIYFDGCWRRWKLPPGDRCGPLEELDVVRLSRSLLSPILGIVDERTDPRISFMGGCAAGELSAAVDSGAADIAFALHPTSLEELLAVAEADLIMPPKSTWFDPKIQSGLFAHSFSSTPTQLP